MESNKNKKHQLLLLILIIKKLKKKLKNIHAYLIRLKKKRMRVFKCLVKNLKMMKITNLKINY